MDPVKLTNINENLGIIRDGQTLMIERRQEVAGNDTIHLKLWNTVPSESYLFQFSPENLSSLSLVSAVLEDKYLHTTTPISLTDVTKVNFSVSANDASSSGPDRFMIVLSTGKPVLPADITSGKSTIKVLQNPITGKSISIQFVDQPKGTYNIVLVNNIGQVMYKGQIKHQGGVSTQKLQLGNRIVKGVYQLRVTNEQAKLKSVIPVLSN
jgi:hypothetical protein